ncbi:MAG: amino acid ABC transporter permease [Eubacteriales bacterium]|nr:amino acid ABC transporter permease [Eubacteriales bacterium]
MLEGSLVTLKIFVFTLIFSIPLGLVLALGKLSKANPLKPVIDLYVLIMRGTPLMLQVLFVYFGAPMIFDIKISNSFAAILAFVLNYAAYFAEIFRGSIISINKGQYEASFALGFTKVKTLFFIVLPQAFRTALPAVTNETITLVKDTALVSIISLEDLLRTARLAVQRDLTVFPFFIAGVFYLIATLILTWGFKKLEERFAFSE